MKDRVVNAQGVGFVIERDKEILHNTRVGICDIGKCNVLNKTAVVLKRVVSHFCPS